MAYKFQMGAAVLSGSLTQEGQVLAKDSALSGSSLSLGGAAITATAAEINAATDASARTAGVVDTSADHFLFCDGGATGATKVESIATLVSSICESGGGVSSDGGGTLELDITGMTSAVVNVADDGFFFADANNGDNIRSGSFVELASGMAGTALTALNGAISVSGVANAQIDNNAAISLTKLAAVTSANVVMGNAANQATATAISGDIALANNGAVTLTAAQTNITSVKNDALVVGRATGNDHIDFSAAGTVAIETNNVARVSVADASTTVSNNLIVAGDLTVQGTSVEIQQGFVVTSSVQFEGATPDGNEISLTSADPSTDRTITLPDLDGHIPLIAGAIGNANVTSAEFLLLDGGSTVGTDALLDSDGFLHNDGGTMKQTQVVKIAELAFGKVSGDATIASGGALTIEANAIEGSMLNNNVISGQTDIGGAIAGTDELLISDAGNIRRTDMSRLKTFIGGGVPAVNGIGDANATLAVGVNASTANASANRTWTLPASSGLTVGESIIIKAFANSGDFPLTIACAGSQAIDNPSTDQIVLESNNAAVTLYYVDTDFFIIV